MKILAACALIVCIALTCLAQFPNTISLPDEQTTTYQKIQPYGYPVSFNFNYGRFNNTCGSLLNGVYSMGWNLNPGGGPVVSGQPFSGVGWEFHYNPDCTPIMENHNYLGDLDGHQWRWVSTLFDPATAYTHTMFKNDRIQFFVNHEGTVPGLEITSSGGAQFYLPIHIPSASPLNTYSYFNESGSGLPFYVNPSPTYGVYAAGFGAGDGAHGKKVNLGFDATNGWGVIQALDQGTAFKPLHLQPNGNRVLIGGATDDGSTMLQVNGAVKLSSLILSGATVTLGDPSSCGPGYRCMRVAN